MKPVALKWGHYQPILLDWNYLRKLLFLKMTDDIIGIPVDPTPYLAKTLAARATPQYHSHADT